MDSQSIFASNVVHAQEMIDSLKGEHGRQLVWVDAVVLPVNLPLNLLSGFVVGLDPMI